MNHPSTHKKSRFPANFVMDVLIGPAAEHIQHYMDPRWSHAMWEARLQELGLEECNVRFF